MPATRARIGQKLSLADANGPRVLPGVLALILFGWLPTLLLALRDAVATGEWPAVAVAFETHVRYLVAGPLFLLADRTVHERIVRCVHELVSGGFIAEPDTAPFRAAAARSQQLRSSRAVTALAFAIALALTVSSRVEPGPDLAARWEALVGLVVFRMLLLVVVWRWFAWALFLARTSRFDLRLVASHPDLAGGLGFLMQPSEAFSIFVLGMGSLASARWSTEVFTNGIPFLVFKKEAILLAVLMAVLGTVPLLPFTGRLFRLRVRALRSYGAFARDYCARFEEKWIQHPAGLDPLGTPDLQSLADLANSFNVVARARPFIATPRLVVTLALSALLPMLPLFATVVPMEEVLPRLLRVL